MFGKKEIENERFIDVRICFGLVKGEPKNNDLIKLIFNFFNSVKKTKKFKIIKKAAGTSFKKKGKNFITQKQDRDIVTIGFISADKYSPIELARDIDFLMKFSILVSKNFLKLPPLIFNNFGRKNKTILVEEKRDILELGYPFKKRVELYKKNRELDKFIFKDDLKDYLTPKNSMFENDKLFEEIKELFNKELK